jgi:hypothetical protein
VSKKQQKQKPDVAWGEKEKQKRLDTIRKSHSDEKDSFPIAFLDKSSTTTF